MLLSVIYIYAWVNSSGPYSNLYETLNFLVARLRLLHTNHWFVSRLKVLYSCSYSRKVICQNDGFPNEGTCFIHHIICVHIHVCMTV